MIIEKKDGQGKPVPFDVRHVSRKGSYVEYKNVRLLTNYYTGGNVRVRLENGLIREFKYLSIVEINGVKTYYK